MNKEEIYKAKELLIDRQHLCEFAWKLKRCKCAIKAKKRNAILTFDDNDLVEINYYKGTYQLNWEMVKPIIDAVNKQIGYIDKKLTALGYTK